MTKMHCRKFTNQQTVDLLTDDEYHRRIIVPLGEKYHSVS